MNYLIIIFGILFYLYTGKEGINENVNLIYKFIYLY